MQGLITFFQGIGDAIVTAFQYLVSLIGDVVALVQGLIWATAQLPKFLFGLPPDVSATLMLMLSFAVLYKILGREG